MAAMQQLDAKLVAYLTGGDQLNASTKAQCVEAEEPIPLTLKKMEQLCSSNSSSSNTTSSSMSSSSSSPSSQQPFEANNNNNNNIADVAANPVSRDTLYEMFSCMSAIKLQLEALTLQPAGTKRMELLQNDIRPIFTVECQLSHELIKSVKPRYDMFHIMQFESEKFQSLTQCTRFGQEAKRAVKLEAEQKQQNDYDFLNNNVNGGIDAKPNFGRIHFTVWWREPGTCLNEMLGMGVLALEELYAANLMEQCKRIDIKRRQQHFANLYLKVSVEAVEPPQPMSDAATNNNLNNNNNGVVVSSTTVTGEYDVVAAVPNSSMTGRMRVEDTKIQ